MPTLAQLEAMARALGTFFDRTKQCHGFEMQVVLAGLVGFYIGRGVDGRQARHDALANAIALMQTVLAEVESRRVDARLDS